MKIKELIRIKISSPKPILSSQTTFLPEKSRSLRLVDRASLITFVFERSERIASSNNEFSPLRRKSVKTRLLFQSGSTYMHLSPKMSDSWLNSIRRVKQTTTSMRFAFHLRIRERGRLDNPWGDFRLASDEKLQ